MTGHSDKFLVGLSFFSMRFQYINSKNENTTTAECRIGCRFNYLADNLFLRHPTEHITCHAAVCYAQVDMSICCSMRSHLAVDYSRFCIAELLNNFLSLQDFYTCVSTIQLFSLLPSTTLDPCFMIHGTCNKQGMLV